MKRWLLAALFVLMPVAAWGACVGPDRSAVSSAIAGATSGSTITVCAGTAQWTSHVKITKPLTIIGAGIDATIITDYGFSVANGVDNWRVSGFTFKLISVTNIDGGICIFWPAGGSSGSYGSTDGCHNWRIDTIKIQPKTGDTLSVGIEFDGWNTGVVHSSQFYGAITSTIRINSGYSEIAAWTQASALGSSNSIFVEDNIFDNNTVSNGDHAVIGGHGGRFVFRSNIIRETSTGRWGDWIDSHGSCHGNSARGNRTFEVYNNTLIKGFTGWGRGLHLRGGTGIVFNNTFNKTAGDWQESGNSGKIYLVDYRASQLNLGTTFTCDATCTIRTGDNDMFCGEGWPCCDQLGRGVNQASEPLYLWNNRSLTGAVYADVTERVGSPMFIVAGRDYYTPTSNGVRTGTRTEMSEASCTTGQAWWVTNEGWWNSRTIEADGALYKCTATDTWTLHYVPYLYPHPRRSELSSPILVSVE